MFTAEDLALLKEKQISEQQVETQLENFKNGFPFLPIADAASLKKGIKSLSDAEEIAFLNTWEQYLTENHTILKFVPASGAASRMFKFLFEFLDADFDEPMIENEKKFFAHIHDFAFYDALNEKCKAKSGKSIDELIADKDYKYIVHILLSDEGLHYGALPKGLLFFHRYADTARTPVEEHMVEGTMYAKSNDGKINIHFTVSPEHKALFRQLVDEKKKLFEEKYGVTYDVTFSIQKPSTDTIAVDMENKPFRNDDGSLLFRPGGHGALIENLNDIDADIVFIKNIDNVIPDELKKGEAKYKRLLAGVLVDYQQKAFGYLEKLEQDDISTDLLKEILQFTENELHIAHPEQTFADDAALKKYLLQKLNRPFRVCGMVKNVGEPGGGPFVTKNSDGTVSLQILESSQIDKNDEKAMQAFKNGSHFNPVDLVCGVKNHKGELFDLTKYVDKNTGFISHKSKSGKELKALELPGLWNGAMSDWNTIFVEVPIETFNPVKNVNDLLRKEHQV